MFTSVPELENCKTFSDILQARAGQKGEQTAYTFLRRGEFESERLTYSELDTRARIIATRLRENLSVGDHALLLFPPGLSFISAFFGCLYAGIVTVPAYPPRRNQSMTRLRAIIADAGASVALTTQSLMDGMGERFHSDANLAKLPLLATDSLEPIADLSMQPVQQVSENSLAFLQYTSGSTGSPKGVMVSHANLVKNSATIYDCFNHSPNSCGVIWLPPYHDMGLIGGILQPLFGGFPVYLMSPVDFLQKPLRWLQAITRFGATTSGGPNFGFDLCLRKISPEQRSSLDLSSWQVAFNGAEPIRWETLKLFADTFQTCGFKKEAFYPCYGMAETTLIVSGGLANTSPTVLPLNRIELERNRVAVVPPKGNSSTDAKNVRHTVSSGITNRFNQVVAIVNPETLMKEPEGSIGEIWVKGDSVALGYWKSPEKTLKSFQKYLASTGDGPYLRTGDLGFLYEEELYVTGRIKDVIIIRGRNYYPQDIEHTVEACNSAFKSNGGAVFGAEIDGEEQLVVMQEINRKYLKSLDFEEVTGNILQAIKTEHALSAYTILLLKSGSLPKTSSGKVRRFACQKSYLEGCIESLHEWTSNTRGSSAYLKLQADIKSLYQTLKT